MLRLGLTTASKFFQHETFNYSKSLLPNVSNNLHGTDSILSRCFGSFLRCQLNPMQSGVSCTSNASVMNMPRRNQGTSKVSHYLPQTRNLLKCGPKNGKPRTERIVLHKFYRLNWGGWIRTYSGRHKKMWTKTAARRKRLTRHVFCNAKQCTLLDKMVTNFWKKPKYFVDDPYEPYHSREEFPYTRQKPVEF